MSGLLLMLLLQTSAQPEFFERTCPARPVSDSVYAATTDEKTAAGLRLDSKEWQSVESRRSWRSGQKPAHHSDSSDRRDLKMPKGGTPLTAMQVADFTHVDQGRRVLADATAVAA